MKFEKWYVEFFNGFYTEFGGHWQFLSDWTGLDYLLIGVMPDIFNGYHHDYYDGHHNTIGFLWFRVSWGGKPLRKKDEIEL